MRNQNKEILQRDEISKQMVITLGEMFRGFMKLEFDSEKVKYFRPGWG